DLDLPGQAGRLVMLAVAELVAERVRRADSRNAAAEINDLVRRAAAVNRVAISVAAAQRVRRTNQRHALAEAQQLALGAGVEERMTQSVVAAPIAGRAEFRNALAADAGEPEGAGNRNAAAAGEIGIARAPADAVGRSDHAARAIARRHALAVEEDVAG